MKELQEIERTFALAPGQDLPAIPPELGHSSAAHVQELDASYRDTVAFHLTRSRLVCRRRSGGPDAGWHVKLPGADTEHRQELQAPLANRLPAQLWPVIDSAAGGHGLREVARLRTRRTVRELTTPLGEVLAQICTDDVAVTVDGTHSTWREAEVELVGGGEPLLQQITEVFLAAGVKVSSDASKIGRALSASLGMARPEGVATVLRDHLSLLVGVLQRTESQVRRDAPDAVHQARVATRKLRCLLRDFSALIPADTSPLRTALRWHARQLGGPRDLEVIQDLLSEPQTPPLPPAVLDQLLVTRDSLMRATVASMDTDRYDRLHTALEQLLADSVALVDPEQVDTFLDPALAKVRRRYAHARQIGGDHAWHQLRKATKAVRYGLAVVAPWLEDPELLTATWKRVTEAFGAHQDAVLARQVVIDLGLEWPHRADWLDDQRELQSAALRQASAALDIALDLPLRQAPARSGSEQPSPG